MTQPWIHKPATDGIFILAPAFIVTVIAFVFRDALSVIEAEYSFYSWLFLIVFVDVAHVYATLFKTYLVREEWESRKKLFIVLPVICLMIGLVLFSFGSQVFWSVLAYVAVFHFIRQQYGFMRLYSRKETLDLRLKWFDELVVYAAAGFPMLYWFLKPGRHFNWFVPDEFFQMESPMLLNVLFWTYLTILSAYVIRTLFLWWKFRWFNIPKNAIIIGTALSWYVGIVWFDNDLVFTLLNVVAHGIPYMALVYFTRPDKSRVEKTFGVGGAIALYLGLILIVAFSEEYLWDYFVWDEHFQHSATRDFSAWQLLFVPILTVPQFTHYLLDGFIWKSKKPAQGSVSSALGSNRSTNAV